MSYIPIELHRKPNDPQPRTTTPSMKVDSSGDDFATSLATGSPTNGTPQAIVGGLFGQMGLGNSETKKARND